MPELETLLRDVRPEPDPIWAASLDSRAAAGFPKPPPRWKRALVALRENFMLVGAATAVPVLIALVLVSGVSTGGGDDDASMSVPTSGGGTSMAESEVPTSDDAGAGAAGTYEEGAAPPDAAAEDLAGQSGPAPAAALPPGAGGGVADEESLAPATRDRAVITSTELVLSTTPDKVSSVNDRAIRVVDSLGGYVEASTVTSTDRTASASLTVKIPSAKLDTGIAQLSRLAHVKSRSQQTVDVTDQRSALEAAVRDARADREGLRARLAKAATDQERSRLRALLDRAARRVTRAERRVAALGREVSYATVALQIDGERKQGQPAAPGGRWTPGDAVKDALRVLEVSAGVLLIAAAALVPLALVALLAILANRAIVHRRREQALETA